MKIIFDDLQGDAEAVISYVEKSCGVSKAMLSERGWIYLVNDTNDFLRVQYGVKKWFQSDSQSALDVVEERLSILDRLKIHYAKFIIPEKSIVYSEFLPRAFSGLETVNQRPAKILAYKYSDKLFYLEDYLQDAKSYGFLYFRGDTHPNWFGAFFIYRFISEYLVRNGFLKWNNIFNYKDLAVSLAGYDGDLYTQLDAEQLELSKTVQGHLLGKNRFESLLRCILDPARIHSFRVETPENYKIWFNTRETIVYEHKNKNLPKALIFRDSTADFLHEILAQHFSRSVFVWHKGQVISDVIEQEEPDIILHIMAERFTIQYPSWKPIYKLMP